MQIKQLTKKIGEDLWWFFKRDSWIVAVMSLVVGKYTKSISEQALFDFLEKECLQYIILIPMPILAIIVYSHICTQGQKKLKRPSERRTVQVLYASGTVVVLFAHFVTIHVSGTMIFYGTPILPYSEKLDFWHNVEIAYALIFTPIFDWYVFRWLLPKKFSEEKIVRTESRFCRVVNIPRKNMIPSALIFFTTIVLLEIMCS